MSGKKRVTQQTIAERLNLSVSSVSRALTGKGEISDATRTQVLDYAKRMGYTPNLIAQSLRSRRTNTFGVIQPDIANPFFARLVRGIEDLAQEKGRSIFVADTYEDVAKEQKLLRLMVDRGVDGILLVPVREREISRETVRHYDVPVILVARCVQDCGLDCVVVDDKRGGYMATEHLISRGYRRIAYLSGPKDMVASSDRLEGYHMALSDYGIPAASNMVHVAGTTLQDGYDAMQRLLDSQIAVDAVFAFNDVIAYGSMRVLHERHIKIPTDVAIIGFDDTSMNMVMNPMLTSVHQPTREMGRRAAERLIDIVGAGSSASNSKVISFNPELRVREST